MTFKKEEGSSSLLTHLQLPLDPSIRLRRIASTLILIVYATNQAANTAVPVILVLFSVQE
jgi:hypothetical protein